MQETSAPPSEFHTLVDTACSIIEAPHQQVASPIPGKNFSTWLHFSYTTKATLM